MHYEVNCAVLHVRCRTDNNVLLIYPFVQDACDSFFPFFAFVLCIMTSAVPFYTDHQPVFEASFEDFERNWICCELFFKVSYIILNTDYCCGRLNLLVNHFHFLKEPFDTFRFTIASLYGKEERFSKSSAADVPFISKPKRQNDFLAS